MVALVFCGDLKYCPYIKRYIEILEENNKEYIVYFWNRSGEQLLLSDNYKYYNEFSKLNKSKAGKIIDFVNFKKWLTTELKKDKPDKIVLLSTLTGIILSDYLSKMNGKYIFDIRDYSYEHIMLYRSIEYKIIENSCFTVISSRGFENFLPQRDYIIAHNFNRNDIKGKYEFRKSEDKLFFVWNGVVRYYDYQRIYLEHLKNDDRYMVVYHGDGPQLECFKDYAKTSGMKNIIFTGAYDNSLKESLLENASILNNCYGYVKNAGNKLKYAVSNRFYDGIIYHIPQLVEPEGFKPQWTEQCRVGLSINPTDNFADDLYNYYMQINKEDFDACCDKALEQIIREDDYFIQRISRFLD